LVFVLFTLQLRALVSPRAASALLVGTEFSAAASMRERKSLILLFSLPVALARRKLRLQFRPGLLAFGVLAMAWPR